MKEQLTTVILTLGIFLAGLFTGVWTQSMKPMGPPPFHPMGEFGGPPGMMGRMHEPPPEIEEFEKKVDALVTEYRDKLKTILTKDQLPLFDDFLNSPPEMMSLPTSGSKGPGSHGIDSVRSSHLFGPMRFIGMVVYRPSLEMMTDEVKLDTAQKEKAEALLRERREKLLALMDAMPPPSIMPHHHDMKGGCATNTTTPTQATTNSPTALAKPEKK